jgi:hypothetical protein
VRLSLFLCLGVFGSACGPPAFASSAWEGDREGWTLSNNGALTDPTLEREGGNPAGHLCGRDEGDGDIWYFVAPRKFLGNASAIFGKRLTFDLKQGSIFNQVRGRDVVLNGGGMAISWNLKFAPGLDWTPYAVRLDAESSWRIDTPTGRGADRASRGRCASRRASIVSRCEMSWRAGPVNERTSRPNRPRRTSACRSSGAAVPRSDR